MERFPEKYKESLPKCESCDALIGSDIPEKFTCVCGEDVCEHCGDECDVCSRLFHDDCINEDKNGIKTCQACTDEEREQATNYLVVMDKIKIICDCWSDILKLMRGEK